MAEIASVASGASGPTSSSAVKEEERLDSRKSNAPHKGVEFASNILNDMGPPPLCSALLLAANAACRPSSPSFSQASTVGAHVDTVGRLCCCCSLVRSVASCSTL